MAAIQYVGNSSDSLESCFDLDDASVPVPFVTQTVLPLSLIMVKHKLLGI